MKGKQRRQRAMLRFAWQNHFGLESFAVDIISPEWLSVLTVRPHSRYMITEEQRRYYETAIRYLASCCEKSGKNQDKTYPLNRGDIMILVMLIEQELKAATPAADLKRFTAIRRKLGELVCDLPQMTKEEAQQFR